MRLSEKRTIHRRQQQKGGAAGLKPGVEFTEILKYAHKLRLAGVPKESALKQTLAYARKLYGG